MIILERGRFIIKKNYIFIVIILLLTILIIAIIYLLLTLIASYVTKLISRKLDGKKVFKLSLFKHYKPKLIEEE